MPITEEMQKGMDEAAEAALEELDQHFNEWSAQDLAGWWIKWYLKAGHKRLGRILVKMGKAHAVNKSSVSSPES
jgi:hypothetical protein